MGQAVKQDIKVLLESKPKFLLVHSSSGHKQALKEVLSHPSVTVRLADTKVRGEWTQALYMYTSVESSVECV